MQAKKPDFKIFAGGAEDGELHDFPDVTRGWGVTKLQTNKKPPLSWMNGAFNRVDNNFYYLLQSGLVEWTSEIEYSANALTQLNGVIYRAKEAVKGESPSASAKWERLFADKVGTSDYVGMSQNAIKKELDKKVSAADLTQTITDDKLKAPSNFAVGTALKGQDKKITDGLGTKLDKAGISEDPNGVLTTKQDTVTLTTNDLAKETGNSHSKVMTQKAVSDALGALGQPSMKGSATLNGATDNTVVLAGVVTTLGLEVGDVIRIQYSGYDKLHSVESITDANSIIVNYEHAGNRGNGSLKLPDFTGQATVTRITKWYNAPIGLGQAWVGVTFSRAADTVYTNTTGNPIMVAVVATGNGVWTRVRLSVSGIVVLSTSSGGAYLSSSSESSSASAIVPAGEVYTVSAVAGGLDWLELR